MNYTFDGHPMAEHVISRHQELVTEAVLQAVPENQLAAIIMIGGYGRSEGAYTVSRHGYEPYNDYDYFVVFQDTSIEQARQLVATIPDLEHQIGIEVDFFPLLREQLSSLEFSLMHAEMRAGHRVIWGDDRILLRMKHMPLEQVPIAEFKRLLTNRGCLLLMNQHGLDQGQFSKYINKVWLAIGDTMLRLVGHYRLSYLEKRELISEVIQDRVIAARYRRAVDIRMRPDLNDEWQQADFEEVRSTLLVLLTALQTEDKISAFAAVMNYARHVRDHRLPWFDKLVFRHPRKRITAGLVSLLRDPDEADAEQLLQLWGSYS